MTPTQLAQAECANYDRGQCLGVLADSLGTGHLVLAKERGACSVEQKRCDYFEKCVLPMADSEHPEAGQYMTARIAYQRKLGQVIPDSAIRRCACGELLPKGYRFCSKCSADRRKATYREEKRRQRAMAVSCPTVVSDFPAQNQPPNGGGATTGLPRAS